ncbi:hypothetical protein ABZP36_023276, partial [Zizania latifolia]
DDYITGVQRIACPKEENEEHVDMEEQVQGQEQNQELNVKVLYDVSCGTPHGHLAIANDDVQAADIKAAATESGVRPSNL